jgi:hypothetical protein
MDDGFSAGQAQDRLLGDSSVCSGHVIVPVLCRLLNTIFYDDFIGIVSQRTFRCNPIRSRKSPLGWQAWLADACALCIFCLRNG